MIITTTTINTVKLMSAVTAKQQTFTDRKAAFEVHKVVGSKAFTSLVSANAYIL